MSKGKRIHRKNIERSGWAQSALDAFTAIVGESGDGESDVGDLLADLMHLCDVQGISFEAALDQGRTHYEWELERPEE